MRLYDVEQSAQDDIMQEQQYDDSIPVYDRGKTDRAAKDFSQLF